MQMSGMYDVNWSGWVDEYYCSDFDDGLLYFILL
jgi:hypothetical protein